MQIDGDDEDTSEAPAEEIQTSEAAEDAEPVTKRTSQRHRHG